MGDRGTTTRRGRGQVIFATAPFLGAAFAWAVLSDSIDAVQLIAMAVAAAGVAASLNIRPLTRTQAPSRWSTRMSTPTMTATMTTPTPTTCRSPQSRHATGTLPTLILTFRTSTTVTITHTSTDLPQMILGLATSDCERARTSGERAANSGQELISDPSVSTSRTEMENVHLPQLEHVQAIGRRSPCRRSPMRPRAGCTLATVGDATFGAILRRRRRQAGLSQEELAGPEVDLLEIGIGVVAKIGRVADPDHIVPSCAPTETGGSAVVGCHWKRGNRRLLVTATTPPTATR